MRISLRNFLVEPLAAASGVGSWSLQVHLYLEQNERNGASKDSAISATHDLCNSAGLAPVDVYVRNEIEMGAGERLFDITITPQALVSDSPIAGAVMAYETLRAKLA